MRHESLFFLFSPITRLKGVGPNIGQALQRLLPAATNIGPTNLPIVRDLLFHLPCGIVDRRVTFPLREAPDDVVATFVVTVDEHVPPTGNKRFSKKPYKVICSNETGEITLVFFNPRDDYIKNTLPIGAKRVISGRVEKRDFILQMPHPDIIAPVSDLAMVQKPEPVYPLTVGLTSRRIGKIVDDTISKLPDLPEWLPHAELTWKAALQKIHHPESQEDLGTQTPAHMRLAMDEILSNQLHLALLRRNMQRQAGEIIKGGGRLAQALVKSLPFSLTIGQKDVLGEIMADMQSGKRMGRLLQGDVGSGKTIVALLAMLEVVEQRLQAALMVPTEIIATQHDETLQRLTAALGVHVVLLTGAVKGMRRKQVLDDIASGKAQIVIGTHALFQEHVQFANLGFVVIDEQHRFGVNQRMALTAKGNAPHLLHMTATPIPRSLTMTLYGDMDCSTLKEKPAERQAITTRLIALSRYQEIMQRLESALARGEKVYWICPLIEEKSTIGEWELSPENDLAAAQTRFAEFKTRFGDKVGLMHGRMKSDARHEAMEDFASGKTRLLVATTVVEVGVDVRDATIIVIEKAERFGLSQLHQLRGRVGRGDLPSACVLLYTDRLGEIARERLGILRESDDGFRIAEVDLVLRGGGDLLGVRQSGMPRFIFTDMSVHLPLLEAARKDAMEFLKTDPLLQSPRGRALQLLLQLFGYEDMELASVPENKSGASGG